MWQLPRSGKGTYGVISLVVAMEDWRFTDGEGLADNLGLQSFLETVPLEWH